MHIINSLTSNMHPNQAEEIWFTSCSLHVCLNCVIADNENIFFSIFPLFYAVQENEMKHSNGPPNKYHYDTKIVVLGKVNKLTSRWK